MILTDEQVAEALEGTILEFPLDGMTPLSSFEWILLRLLAEAKQIFGMMAFCLEEIEATTGIEGESMIALMEYQSWLTRLQGGDDAE